MSIFNNSRSLFATALLEARNKSGLTAVQVAEKIGKASHSAIIMWESDKALPRLNDFVELCKIYNVTPNELLGFNT